MKKFLILASPIILLAGAADADVSVGINFGEPVVAEPVYPVVTPVPTYIEPAPDWPSYHYDRHRYPHNHYWAHQRRDEHEHAPHR